MDDRSILGNDGKGLFNVESGKGFFARRTDVAGLVVSDIGLDPYDEEYIELKKSRSRIKKKIKEIMKLENDQKNKRNLDNAQLMKIQRLKHYQDKLREIDDKLKNLPSKSQNNKRRGSIDKGKKRRGSIDKNLVKVENIEINDRIKLANGKTGIVQHTGAVEFTDEEVIGIVLDKWHPNANNGTVKGKQYFVAPPGWFFYIIYFYNKILRIIYHQNIQYK